MFKIIGTGIKLLFGTAAAGTGLYGATVVYPDKTKSGLKSVFNAVKGAIVGPDKTAKEAAADKKENAETPADKKEAPATSQEQTPPPAGSDKSTWQRIKEQGAENRKWLDKFFEHPLDTTLSAVFGDKSKKKPGEETTPYSWLGNLLGAKNAMGEVDLFSILKTGGILGGAWFLLNSLRGGGTAVSSALVIAGAVALYNYWDDIAPATKNAVNKYTGVSIGGEDTNYEVSVPEWDDNDEPAPG